MEELIALGNFLNLYLEVYEFYTFGAFWADEDNMEKTMLLSF